MTAYDRQERFANIRAGLDYPLAQRPSPDQILREMLFAEQMLTLRLANSRKPWSLVSYELVTTEGTRTYSITQPIEAFQSSGKVHVVVRATENTDLPFLEIPFNDFTGQDYGNMPPSGQVNNALMVPESIAFYRTSIQSQTIKAIVNPTPQEALTYTIYFLVGSLDRSRAELTDTGPLVELSDYIDNQAMLSLIDRCEWRDDDVFNDRKRASTAARITAKLASLEGIVEKYISNINAPASFTMGAWNED